MSYLGNEYSIRIKKHLLESVIPFWMGRDIDSRWGGYLTCFDRQGELTDDNKYIWFQGRQLYVYALLYNTIEQRPEWLEEAKHGFEFLTKYGYAGNGRWYFKLNRQGDVLVGTNSIYSDYHVAQGLAEYAKAIQCGDELVMRLLNETYTALEKNTTDPDFKDIYENTWSPVFIWNDMYLTAINTACIATGALGIERTRPLIRECADKMMHWFTRDEYQLMFEAIGRDNTVRLEGEGRFINPGHSMESAWFLMEAGRLCNDSSMTDRALQIINWTYAVGYDKNFGGIYSYLDAEGGEPIPLDWHRETNSMWDDKVWWVNAESLSAFASAYALTHDEKYRDMLDKQWRFCIEHFYDAEYGEWYERLNPDGSVKVADKGTPWKCAFHLARTLIHAMEILGDEQ